MPGRGVQISPPVFGRGFEERRSKWKSESPQISLDWTSFWAKETFLSADEVSLPSCCNAESKTDSVHSPTAGDERRLGATTTGVATATTATPTSTTTTTTTAAAAATTTTVEAHKSLIPPFWKSQLTCPATFEAAYLREFLGSSTWWTSPPPAASSANCGPSAAAFSPWDCLPSVGPILSSCCCLPDTSKLQGAAGLEAELGTQVATGATLGSFVVGLHLATACGLGTSAPDPLAVLSSATAAAASAGCLWSLAERGPPSENSALGHIRPDGIWISSAGTGEAPTTAGQESTKVVELPRWSASMLASLCGLLSPLALVPVSKAAAAGVSSKVRMALPGGVGLAVLFELCHRYAARIDAERVGAFLKAEEAEERTRSQKATNNNNNNNNNNSNGPDVLPPSSSSSSSWTSAFIDDETLERILSHWQRHFLPSKDWARGVGGMFLLLQLLITGCAVHIDLSMTAWRSTFFNVLQAKDVAGFHRQLWDFMPIAAASTLASVYDGYLTTMWDLRWREELVRDFVGLWLSDKSYLFAARRAANGPESEFEGLPNINIDNFDQRIVEDTGIFASSSRALICGALAAAMRLVVFGPALLRTAPTAGIWQLCLALSMFSSLATHFVGHPLTARSASLQRAEADFRSSLMRLRLFAEEIAERQGEAAEEEAAGQYFENIKAATWLAARGTLNLSVFTSVYGLAGGLLPFFVLVPSYFHGDISLGTMFQIEGIIGGVRQSLDFFVGAYGEIAVWRAATERLLALEAWVKHQEEHFSSSSSSSLLSGPGLGGPHWEEKEEDDDDNEEGGVNVGAVRDEAHAPTFRGQT